MENSISYTTANAIPQMEMPVSHKNQLNLSYLGGQKNCHFLGILKVNEDPIMFFSNFGSFPRL